MTEFNPKIDAAFREYADLTLRRHHWLAAGKEDSAEVAETEDRMDALWPTLDEVQRRSLNGMASDLNWVRRDGALPPNGRRSPMEVKAEEQQALTAAIQAEDWPRVLHYLRLCAPAFEAASLARERGLAYESIGLPGYAKVFNTVEFTRRIAVAEHP